LQIPDIRLLPVNSTLFKIPEYIYILRLFWYRPAREPLTSSGITFICFRILALISHERSPARASMLMTRPNTTAISPFFIVSNVDQTIAFYRDKLGFEIRFQEPNQNPFFAIIGREGAQLFLKSEKDVLPLPNPKRHPSMRWDSFVYAPDPDALAADLAEHGAAFSEPLKDTHDGLRGFEIRDPDGYVLFFGRPR
jgi:catechol 2,3-dioxygenase-like lactoylglutathione lyase family enzyme